MQRGLGKVEAVCDAVRDEKCAQWILGELEEHAQAFGRGTAAEIFQADGSPALERGQVVVVPNV